MQLYKSSGHFSPCGRYRYCLSWELVPPGQPVREVCFVLCNPPMGDAVRLDATAKKVIGWAAGWGFTGVRLLNLFAWRAGEPVGLGKVKDPIGPENDRWLGTAVGSAVRVAAWGSAGWSGRRSAHNLRARIVWRRLHSFGGCRCVGVTHDLHPRHPLFFHGVPALAPCSCPP